MSTHEYRIYGPLSGVTGAALAEYDRAKAKHGDNTPDGSGLTPALKDFFEVTSYRLPYDPNDEVRKAVLRSTDVNRLATLIEEVGEVGRCLTYDKDHAGSLYKELIQVAAMALAWASIVDPNEKETSE